MISQLFTFNVVEHRNEIQVKAPREEKEAFNATEDSH